MAVVESTMPETISDARANLTTYVARFRQEGLDADPIVFGDHRQAEAVLLPYETFSLLLDLAEDVAIAARIRERLEGDGGNRTSLSAAAAELGIDLDER